MSNVIAFPSMRTAGTIHVMLSEGSYYCSHESSSGNSWGEMHGPNDSRHSAIWGARLLNTRDYQGKCEVCIPPEADGVAETFPDEVVF